MDFLGDIHASQACSPSSQHWGAPKIDNGNKDAFSSPLKESARVLMVLLYGSWNVRLSTVIRSEKKAASIENGTPDANSNLYGHNKWINPLNITMEKLLQRPSNPNIKVLAASVQVDADDESSELCVKDEAAGGLGCPPELPSLAFIALPGSGSNDWESRVEHVTLNHSKLGHLLEQTANNQNDNNNIAINTLLTAMESAWSQLFDSTGHLRPPTRATIPKNITNKSNNQSQEPAIRIFIAGDKSQVGKSSICMGLLGSLLQSKRHNFTPSDLAYIKPATQCEQTQLVEEFCKHKGITACVPIGPVVYYKGFTRAFLKGETSECSEELLEKAAEAVDRLAIGKRVVIVDGVGYPAVGSITGTDNASVAAACGRPFTIPQNQIGVTRDVTSGRAPIPVLLVGKSGVGDAVDSFNLNATFFTNKNVPVIGAVFNKLSLEGFYSLRNCKEAVSIYFEKFQPERKAFGFIPEIPSLLNARESVADKELSEEVRLKKALESADLFVEQFSKHVDVDAILSTAEDSIRRCIEQRKLDTATFANDYHHSRGSKRSAEKNGSPTPSIHFQAKYPRLSDSAGSKHTQHANSMIAKGFSLTRQQIEAMASAAGAAGG